MTSKTQDSKLTLDNLSQQLKKWKQPYLKQVKQTAKQFQQKVRDHRKHTMENVQNMKTRQTDQNSNKQIEQKNQNDSQKVSRQKRQPQQKISSPPIEPKLQQWKSNNLYGFKDYDELVKNYSQVFKKKQKVKKTQKDQTIQDFRADQRQMVNQIYQDLKDPSSLTVSFNEIQQFFQNYELFYYFYNIHPYRLLNILKESAKKYENKLTRQQFFDFFLVDRPTVSQFKTATEKNVCNQCILSEEVWKKLKNIFDTLDTFGNEKICVKTFFQRIRNSPSCISILSAEAIQFPQIYRVYTFQKVLFDLQNKMSFNNKVDWDTIEDMIFGFTHIQEPTLDKIYENNIKKAKISRDSNYFVLEPKVLEIIKQIFNRCPKYCESFVKTAFFSYELLEAGLLKPHLNSATRLQNSTRNSYLTLQQVIKKFSKQAPSYIDMDEMLEFISIKGSQNSRKLINIYDQIETSSSQQQTLQLRNQRRLKKIKSLEQLKKTMKKKQKKKKVYQVTRVKQFNLFKREQPTIRQQRVQQMIKQKQAEDERQLKKKFKSNPIPVSLNPERYNKYVKCLQKKKQSILNRLGMKRQKDQIIIDYLKSNTRLFEEKSPRRHCDDKIKQNYVYQATPLPLHVSQELLPKIQAQKQERRKRLLEETNKKYNQVYWKNIRETSSFDKDDSLLQKINLIEQKQKFEQIKANQVPNFEQLHRKFQEELKNRKKQYKPTKIQQFKLSSINNRKKNDSYASPQPYHFKSKSPPKFDQYIEIKSTKKYQDWVAHNQAMMNQKQLKRLKKQQQKEQNLIKQRNFANFMRQNLMNCTDNTQLLKQKSLQKIKKYKSHVNQLKRQTEQQLAQIYARVLQRPFLFQEAGATRKPRSKQRPKKININNNNQPQHPENHPYKQGLFEKQGEEFHPIQSQNLNQSF